MIYLLLALVLVGVVTASLTFLFSRGKEETPIIRPSAGDCSSCGGGDDRCELDCMMEAAVRDIEYYEDEDLDEFRGRSSDSYTEGEVERFAEVLYTLRPEEVKGWSRSLTLRGINIPDPLKDELLLMIDDGKQAG